MKKYLIPFAAIALSGGLMTVSAHETSKGMCSMQQSNSQCCSAKSSKSSKSAKSDKDQACCAVFSKDLKLTPEQKEKISAIVKSKQPKFEKVRNDAHARMKKLGEATKKDIRRVLTPEQIQTLDNAAQARNTKTAAKTK